MRIAVAGGTGVLGSKVVARLEQDGHEPVVLSRSTGVDLASGSGLGDRLTGIDAVVDATSIETTRRSTAVRFFTAITENLLRAEQKAGVGHHVVVSIVGIDDIPFGYYEGKVAQEATVTDGPVPWSIMRITQFHEFPGQVMDRMAVGPVSFVPTGTSQPIAAAEAAGAIAELAVGAPAGRVPDLAGPQPEQLVDLARRLVGHRRERRLIVPVRLPGAAGRGMRDGSLIPSKPGPRGTMTFDEWLAGLEDAA
jgi:uncharacterized protein YbjT (DUF2867 family)